MYSECDCGLGTVDDYCTDEGQCSCLPGVTGSRCDQCLPFYSALSSAGCQPCSGCEVMLASQIASSDLELASIGTKSLFVQTLIDTDVAGNNFINMSLFILSSRMSVLLSEFEVIEGNLEGLNQSVLQAVIINSVTAEHQVN